MKLLSTSIFLTKARHVMGLTKMSFYFQRLLSFPLLTLMLLITSCPDFEPDKPIDKDKDQNETEADWPQLELLPSKTNLQDNWLADHDFSAWNENEYWNWREKNTAPPGIKGKLIEFKVTVIAKDREGNPIKGTLIKFLPEAGTVMPSSARSGSDGTVTVLWKFNGSWETWGNWDLSITGFKIDGITPLEGTPIIVQGVISAPPGV